MKLIRFATRNSLLFNLLSVLVLVVGTIKAFQMRREAFPEVDFDVVMVQTFYPGASPREVELYVTDLIEEEIATVDGIEEMNSTSVEGFSLVAMKLDPDMSVREKDKTVTDIQRAVDRVRNLPEELPDPPLVRELTSGDHPIIEVALGGNLPYARLHALADQLEDRLETLRDVEDVSKLGYREREFWVEVDPERLRRYDVSLGLIIASLAAHNINLPAGVLKSPEGEYLVRTIGEVRTPAEIESIILRANDAGIQIKLGDVGGVRSTFEEASNQYRTNGHEAINLQVLKATNGDVIRLVDQVKAETEAFVSQSGETGLEISYINDISLFVRNRLNVLVNNGIFGLALVVVSLLLFLSRGIALVTAWGMPIAFMGTLLIMGYAGITINLISMFGLIIVLGMLVDDAIIVAENIWQRYERGDPPHEAVLNGTAEVFWPVTATILTTMAAFLPLLMMTGIFGKFVSTMPKVVIVALAVSLAEAMLILPSHAHEVLLLRERRQARKRATGGAIPAEAANGALHRVIRAYTGVLRVTLRFRYLFTGGIVAVFLLTLAFAKANIPFVLFPSHGIEIFFIRAELPIGTPLDVTSEKFKRLETLVDSLPEDELHNYVTHIGIQQNDPNDPFTQRGSYVGQIITFLTPENERDRTADEIIEALRGPVRSVGDDLGFTRLFFDRARPGPPVGKPVAIRLKGDDLDELSRLAGLVREKLSEIEGAKDIAQDYVPGKKEMKIVIDEKAAAGALLTVQQIAAHVQAALEGQVATFVRAAGERIPLRVRFREEDRKNQGSLSDLAIPNAAGHLVPLSAVAHFERTSGVNSISHRERKRTVTVTAAVDETVTSSQRVNTAILPYLAELESNHPGLLTDAGGEFEETAESLASLREAFIVALGLIFVILTTQFRSLTQPLVVMAVIPFGIIGVIWAFYFHGLPLSFIGLIGAIGLSGVVVNDSIVLVSFINSARASGLSVFDAAMLAGPRRFRAVWLTTITTVLGLLPLVYGIGGSDKFLRPAALALGFGLLFATVLVLFFVPSLYVIRSDVGALYRKLRRR